LVHIWFTDERRREHLADRDAGTKTSKFKKSFLNTWRSS